MKKIILILTITTSLTAVASDKACKKQCKDQLNVCKDKVSHWVEGKYIELEGSESYMKNRELTRLYKMVDMEEKEMKNKCKLQNTECLNACEEQIF